MKREEMHDAYETLSDAGYTIADLLALTNLHTARECMYRHIADDGTLDDDERDAIETLGLCVPPCECGGCDCERPATTTDDGGTAVCSICATAVVTGDGDIICPDGDRGAEVEIVTECCGAGGQTRSYSRLRPPAMPEADPDGEWALYWDTVGQDAHVVARFASRDDAIQAANSTDWPRPGDHTQYLCGYAVRQLVDGQWVIPDAD